MGDYGKKGSFFLGLESFIVRLVAVFRKVKERRIVGLGRVCGVRADSRNDAQQKSAVLVRSRIAPPHMPSGARAWA